MDKPDRLELEARKKQYMRTLEELINEENTELNKQFGLAEKLMDKITSGVLKLKLLLIKSGLTSVGRARVIKYIVFNLIESLSPVETYGLFSAIQFDLQEKIRGASMSPVMVVPLGMGLKEPEKEEKNPLVT